MRFSPLRGAKGQVLGVIGVLMDLTEEEDAKVQIEDCSVSSLMEVAREVMVRFRPICPTAAR